MNEQERNDKRNDDRDDSNRNWQSIRTGIEVLILGALMWSANALTETQTQIAVLQTDIANLRVQLAPLAHLDQRVTRLEALSERRREP